MKGETPSYHSPAWMWQASQMPFPVLSPTVLSTSKESLPRVSVSLPDKKPCSVIIYNTVSVFAVQLLQSRARAKVHGGGSGRKVWRSGSLLEWETALLSLGAKRKLPRKPSNSSVPLCRGCGCRAQLSPGEQPLLGGCRLLLPTRSRAECVSSAALGRLSRQLPSSRSGVVRAWHAAPSQGSALQ